MFVCVSVWEPSRVWEVTGWLPREKHQRLLSTRLAASISAVLCGPEAIPSIPSPNHNIGIHSFLAILL